MKIIALVAALLLAGTSLALARPDVNVDADGVGAHGYDLVAYLSEDAPVEGRRAHQVTHDGILYRFASAANAAAFAAEPARHLPAYGGFCAYGVAMGRKFDTKPIAWKIVDGRLYLELDQGIRAVWLREVPRNIAIADRIWPEIEQVPAAQLGN
ncbi:YHS domain-containing (seleno)protein [Marinibaculum pumilum]|uniref:YHS domain-containing (Seleno)protein n=1 Tax=Marinibaculum pumilum TaxID=1766165 RepID=A0ABV7L3L4_9PROT